MNNVIDPLCWGRRMKEWRHCLSSETINDSSIFRAVFVLVSIDFSLFNQQYFRQIMRNYTEDCRIEKNNNSKVKSTKCAWKWMPTANTAKDSMQCWTVVQSIFSLSIAWAYEIILKKIENRNDFVSSRKLLVILHTWWLINRPTPSPQGWVLSIFLRSMPNKRSKSFNRSIFVLAKLLNQTERKATNWKTAKSSSCLISVCSK